MSFLSILKWRNGVYVLNNFTFHFLLKACTRLCWVKTGCEIHGKVVKFGFESNTFGRNTLTYFHANCGDLNIAKELFDGSAKRDVVPWLALTAGYARRGELNMARQLFDEKPIKDLVSWNVMITGYAKGGDMDGARKLFDQVPKPDVVTWNAMIAGYVLCGSHEQAFEIRWGYGCRREDALLHYGNGFEKFSTVLGNALIDMYAKCGSIEMQREKIKPNEITFVGVLVAHSHGGMVKEGRQYFDLMRIEYGIEPTIKHYGCMVDILGRVGLLDEAIEFVEEMEIKPNPIIWRTLLGTCRIQGNVELKKRANEQLLTMRRDQSGDYELLSNIYALTGEWDGVEKTTRRES